MTFLWESAGFFFWPLLGCSLVALTVILERFRALLTHRVVPPQLIRALAGGHQPGERGNDSVLGRILALRGTGPAEHPAWEALARLEVHRLERGLVVLEVVIAIAPLIGLLGTVTGLVKVFAHISPETGMPDPAMFAEGVAMALVTTGLGLAIAIPSLVFHGYFQRKVDNFAVEIEAALALSARSRSEDGDGEGN